MTLADTSSTNPRTTDIYRAAAKLMVKSGFGGTSIADIAKAVGMTKAGLYHHISGKDDMLFQIIEDALDVLEARVITPAKQNGDPAEQLRLIIRLHIEGILDHGPAATLLFSEIHHLDDKQRFIVMQRIEQYLGFVEQVLSDLADQGRLRDMDTAIASRHIVQSIVGVARWYPREGQLDREALIDETVAYHLAAVLRERSGP